MMPKITKNFIILSLCVSLSSLILIILLSIIYKNSQEKIQIVTTKCEPNWPLLVDNLEEAIQLFESDLTRVLTTDARCPVGVKPSLELFLTSKIYLQIFRQLNNNRECKNYKECLNDYLNKLKIEVRNAHTVEQQLLVVLKLQAVINAIKISLGQIPNQNLHVSKYNPDLLNLQITSLQELLNQDSLIERTIENGFKNIQ